MTGNRTGLFLVLFGLCLTAWGAEGPVLRLSVGGDAHWGSPRADSRDRARILERVAGSRPRRDAFLLLGDIVERGWEPSHWRQAARELTREDLPPILAVPGNHDGWLGGEAWFRRTFPAGLSPDQPLYRVWDTPAALVILLDLRSDERSFSRAQEDWLRGLLSAQPPGRIILVFTHAFLVSSGYREAFGLPFWDQPGLLRRLAPILEKGGVDLVVSGHNHYMEWLQRGPVSYAVAGSLGGRPDPEPTFISPSSRWFRRGVLGWLDLDVDPAGITATFRDAQGRILHTEIGAAEGQFPSVPKSGKMEWARPSKQDTKH